MRDTVSLREDSARLRNGASNLGAINELDVARARTSATTRGDAIALERQRACSSTGSTYCWATRGGFRWLPASFASGMPAFRACPSR